MHIELIFKSGARDDRLNYRPRAVLPFICRLFVKVIFNQFYEYLEANKSLYELQSVKLQGNTTVTLFARTLKRRSFMINCFCFYIVSSIMSSQFKLPSRWSSSITRYAFSRFVMARFIRNSKNC